MRRIDAICMHTQLNTQRRIEEFKVKLGHLALAKRISHMHFSHHHNIEIFLTTTVKGLVANIRRGACVTTLRNIVD
jgi:hypothetical protein